ncbi:MAG: glutamate racemase [Tepidanaerobacteraceae bacterium]|nr:glutamate racemase [Tepidanaerobacteraceae bacterium]
MAKPAATFGVIAGTPVDTKMGVDFIKSMGFDAVGIPAASSPEEQNMLQYQKADTLTQKVIAIIDEFHKKNIKSIMIYCNSLSAAIDFKLVENKYPSSNILTPLQAYCNLALRYSRLIVWAANAQSLKVIEQILYESNPYIRVIGVTLLPVVNAIENLMPPEDILEKFGLANFLPRSFGAEGLVLGCTHFPYLKKILEEKLDVAVVDPMEEVLKDFVSHLNAF